MLSSRTRYIAIASACCLALVVLTIAIVWYRQQDGRPPQKIIVQDFPTRTTSAPYPTDGYGLYESCPPSEGERCFARLAQMARGGFKLVMNYSQLSGTIDQELRYAYQAKVLGVKIIWNFSDPHFIDGYSDVRTIFPALASNCNCSDNEGFIRYVVGMVRYLPATWGYYVGDEVSVTQLAQVQALAAIIHSTDPQHPRLLDVRSPTPEVNKTLALFAGSADVLMQDFYPVGHYNINLTSAVATGVQAIADTYGKSSAMALQAFSLGNYASYHNLCAPFPSCMHYPTVAQMRLMRNLVVQHSRPRLILWFSFPDVYNYSSGQSQPHWQNLQAAIAS